MKASASGETGISAAYGNARPVEIVRGTISPNSGLSRAVIALGNFDGFHRGHRFLLQQTHRLAAQGLPVAIMSAEPHPRQYFNPAAPVQRLALPEQKYRQARQLGLDYVFEPRFDRSFASLSPGAFVREILHDMLKVSNVVIGENFRFGAGRAGDCAMLAELAAPLGIGVEIVNLQDRFSSTGIREALTRGDLETVHDCLGRPWEAELVFTGSGYSLAAGLIRPAAGQYLVHDRVRAQTFTTRLDAHGRLDIAHEPIDRITFLARLSADRPESCCCPDMPFATAPDDRLSANAADLST